MSRTPRAPLLLTPGDPAGIGPEVACKALVAHRPSRPVVLVGDADAILQAADRADLTVLTTQDLTGDEALPRVIEPPDTGEPVEVAALRWSVARCLDGSASALVTGPIHKARLAARGFAHPGHTEFLAELCHVTDPVMAFVGGQLRVALVTVHLPLRAVADAVTTGKVLHTVRAAHTALREQLGLSNPRLLVCGLNPHAGDEGVLGHEDRDVIAPAVAEARREGIDAVGPISAEAAMRGAIAGQGDLVVAMYHDQGLAPLKAVDFGRSVNWTLGLPIVRTSVDHGTADDLAGRWLADPASMVAALDLADRLARARAS